MNKFIDQDTHALSNNRLVNHMYYDFLCLTFFNELYNEKLYELPPFNGECLLANTNILFVNKHGESIMVSKEPNVGVCTMYNSLIKLMEGSNIRNKIISTASNTTLTQTGRVPKAAFTKEAINELFQGMIKGDNEKDKLLEHDKKMYNEFVAQNANIFKDEHNKIKNSSDVLKNYFCYFRDDMDEQVDFNDNEVAYDTARKLYPQIILENRRNRLQGSLDFSVKNNDESVIDEEHQPNVSYVQNLGYCTLMNICNNSPLILKNVAVLFPNLRNRYTKDGNAIISNISSSSGCKRKPGGGDYDDDYDDYILPRATIISDMPEKKKPIPGTIELTGEKAEYDINGHIKRIGCVGPSIKDFMNQSIRMNGSSQCLSGI